MAWRLFGAKPLTEKKCWLIVNWNLKNKLQWNFNQNMKFFIQENGFENVLCEMAAILSREDEVFNRQEISFTPLLALLTIPYTMLLNDYACGFY